MDPGEVLLVDHPGHPYALRFMRTFFERFGMRSVCVYLDEASMRLEVPATPEFGGEMVSGMYLAESAGFDTIADVLRRNHDIRAVVPYIETAVTPSIQLGRRLGVSWAMNPALDLFRDKHALKQLLRSMPQGPRINAVAAVTDVAGVTAATATGHFERYVLKPNDGFGNTSIAFFHTGSSDEVVGAYLAAQSGPVLMEEFIAGDEFTVNGMVDADGEVTVLGISREGREPWNGRPNVQTESRTVREADPVFAPMRAYVESAVHLSGLRRSPFHMDAKFDEQGPCMVEIGARLAGVGGADDMATAHNHAIDPFALAAHYYLTADSPGPVPTDWSYYNSHVVNTIMGVSQDSGRIWDLSGTDSVQDKPEFRGWVKLPHVGQRVTPTVDLDTSAWMVRMITEDDESMNNVVSSTRDSIRWNQGLSGAPLLMRKARTTTRLALAKARTARAFRRARYQVIRDVS